MQEHGLLQAVARVNRPFTHEQDGVATDKGYGLVVDYYGVSRNLEAALEIFDASDVSGAMRELDEDPTTVLEAAVVAAESHFRVATWTTCGTASPCSLPTPAPRATSRWTCTSGSTPTTAEFSHLMDRAMPNAKALPYVGRLARLTEIRAYARAHFLQEDARLNWTDIGAKVKKLIDERIDANVRELMKPVSVLDQDFDQKIAALPHDEARASVMEHTIRAYINEKLADNPVFYGKLSEQLERIIQDLRNQVIDAAEAAKLQAALKAQLDSEQDIAAQLGLIVRIFRHLRDHRTGRNANDLGGCPGGIPCPDGRERKRRPPKRWRPRWFRIGTWWIGRPISRSSVSCAATSSACPEGRREVQRGRTR